MSQRHNFGMDQKKNSGMNQMKISRSLSKLLRHTAVKEGLNIDEEGYCFLDDVLKLKIFSGATEDQVKQIVQDNNKQRFTLIKLDDKYKIRANQGHSEEIAEKLNFKKILKKVNDPKEISNCIHGTYKKYLDTIKKYGLSRRNRHAIHCCTGFDAKSGYRQSCEIGIHIDVEKAMKDGFEFYISDNGVILCEGDLKLKDKDGYNGVLPPQYFKKFETLK